MLIQLQEPETIIEEVYVDRVIVKQEGKPA